MKVFVRTALVVAILVALLLTARFFLPTAIPSVQSQSALLTNVLYLTLELTPVLFLAIGACYLYARIRDKKLAKKGYWLMITPPDKVSEDSNLTFWKTMRQLLHPPWKALVYGQPYLIWELRLSAHRPELCVWAPEAVSRQTLKNAIESAWPGAKVSAGLDYVQTGWIAQSRLRPLERHLHSIHLANDTEYLRGLIGSAAGLTGDESIVVSVLAQPAHKPIHRKRQADPYKHYSATGKKLGKDVLVPIPAYVMNVRVSVATTSTMAAKERIHGVNLAFGVFEGANRLHRYKSKQPAREFHKMYRVSTDELAVLAPMPTATVLRTGRSWEVIADATVPREGKVLGLSGGRSVAMTVRDSTTHCHITGVPGTGKTTLLTNMILQDIEAGRSVVVIDWAKGDMIDWILQRFPTGREQDLCLIDPMHPTHAVGLDVLTHTIADLSVEHAIGYLAKLWTQLGDQQEAILRNAVLLLSYVPGATLMEVPTLLSNNAWRKRVLQDLEIPDAPSLKDDLIAFFMAFGELTDSEKARSAGPLTNKLRSFLLKSSIRFVLGQSFVAEDPFKTLEHGGIILARVPKSELGPKQASLLSSIITAKTWEQVMSRSGIPEKDRYPTCYYGDEVQNYLRGSLFHSVEEMLTEARGWGMGVVLAHQYLEQLPDEVKPAVEACCRTKITFKISAQNAHAAVRMFSPLTEHDIASIPEFSAICHPVNGNTFSFQTVPLLPGSITRKEEVTGISMAKWGRLKTDIEQEIIARKQNPARVLQIGAKGI